MRGEVSARYVPLARSGSRLSFDFALASRIGYPASDVIGVVDFLSQSGGLRFSATCWGSQSPAASLSCRSTDIPEPSDAGSRAQIIAANMSSTHCSW